MSGSVLFCYDGSDCAAHAIERAATLLVPRRALVCHTWIGLSRVLLRADTAGLEGPIAEAAREIDETDDRLARELATEGAHLARAAGFDAQPLAVEERAKTWRTILATAEEHASPVIVLGARGRTGVAGALLGSVSSAVANHAERPVLIVPRTTPAGTGPLLLAHDGSDHAAHAIRTGAELLSERRAVVVDVWRSWAATAPGLARMSAGVGEIARKLDESVERQAEEVCAEGAELARSAGLEPDQQPRRGDGPEWRALLDAADEVDAAAIVMGSRGLTGLSGVLGSVSHGLVHQTRRPVLVVPAPHEP